MRLALTPTTTHMRYWVHHCPGCLAENDAIPRRFRGLDPGDVEHHSHFFAGRYENVYVRREAMPESGVILHTAQAQAAAIPGHESERLRLGVWFNEMKPGHKTLPHAHDDADELLSGVYYVGAPPCCGKFVLRDGNASVELEPQAGMSVFFPPDLLHEVEPNPSDETRLSLGMNFGPLDRTDVPCFESRPRPTAQTGWSRSHAGSAWSGRT